MIKYFDDNTFKNIDIQEVKLQEKEYEPAEVVDIIYDKNHPFYEDESDIGTIIFRRLFTDFDKSFEELPKAKPLNPNINTYPIRFETVLILKSIAPTAGTTDQATTYYYLNTPTNTWNLINHNALPFIGISTYDETQKDLLNKKGINNSKSVGYIDENKKEKIILGDYFYENPNINKLLPFEGDTIIQSRFGSSIRFSYNTNPNTNNFWSKNKESVGNPIIIISNTKPTENKFDWKIEDINKEDSIIVLTSGQKIDLQINSKEQKTFDKGYKPLKINQFQDNQIIFNSDRIVLNTKKDSLLIFNEKSTYISSKNSINLFTDNYINLECNDLKINNKETKILSDKIFLSTENQLQPAVLGNELLNVLIEIIQNLLTMTFNTAVGPTTPMNPPALNNFTTLLTKLQTLKPILSKKIFLS